MPLAVLVQEIHLITEKTEQPEQMLGELFMAAAVVVEIIAIMTVMEANMGKMEPVALEAVVQEDT